ncbi:hypothetical protein [Blastococcus sp. SYSU D00813]
MRDDPQELVDRVAAVLGAPATLEDPDSGLPASTGRRCTTASAGSPR